MRGKSNQNTLTLRLDKLTNLKKDKKMEKKFSVTDTISRAVDVVKEHAAYLILTPLLFWVANNITGSSSASGLTGIYMSAIPQIADGTIDWEALSRQISEAQAGMLFTPTFWISILLSWLLSIFYQVGYMRFQLQAIDGNQLEANGFVTRFETYVQYFFTSLACGAIIVTGTLLCILPGIYLGVRLWLAPYYVVDRGMSCSDALKTCWHDMQGNWLTVFMGGILLLLIGIGGWLLCCVGALFTTPLVAVAAALIYREISKD